MHRRFVLYLASCSLTGGIALDACSPSPTTPGVDASTDAAGDSPTADVVDAAPEASFCPTYTGTDPFCQAMAENCMACGKHPGAACANDENFPAVCARVEQYVGVQCIRAFIAAPTNCGTICGPTQLDGGLTDAQLKAADDYCTVCGDSGACPAKIVMSASLGYYSDEISTEIDTLCTPDSGTMAACTATYGACIGDILAAHDPSLACDAGSD